MSRKMTSLDIILDIIMIIHLTSNNKISMTSSLVYYSDIYLMSFDINIFKLFSLVKVISYLLHILHVILQLKTDLIS